MTIKQCPFCGGPGRAVVVGDDEGTPVVCVVCDDCSAEGPTATCTHVGEAKTMAIHGWNIRAEETDPDA